MSSPAGRATRRAFPPAGTSPAPPNWAGAARTAYRFGCVYAGLYCLTSPQVYLALRGGGMGHLQEAADAWAKRWAIRPVRNWMSVRVLGRELGDRFDGGDDPHTWAGQVCWLAGAAAATPVWSVLDRRRTDRAALDKWFRLAARFCLAGQMFSYGAAKAVPLQFQLPPSKLVEPLGGLTPMSLLWAQTGSSKPYQILLGCAEITGGLLLIVPRTAPLGALLCAVEMAQVLLLNMTFDVPVKVHSFHLLLLGLLLLAPHTPRLADAAFTQRPLPAAAPTDLFRSRRANRIATALQAGAGLLLLGAQLRNDWAFWKNHGGGREKPELYGVWDVTGFSVDGEQLPPVTTDDRRWRRIVVDSVDAVAIQHMDDSLAPCMASIDMNARSVALTKMADPKWQVTFAFERPADDLLILDGEVDGHHHRLHLRRRDLTTFPLVSRGFHWVQENSSLR
ncbi:DoxX family protein [Streptomyces sp. PT12]|uniref:DoxX family protein n=1 Tax=Streptomyces sp. PT12 TaxID=1510197 RepID=UPI000DE33009|nr:DoxX family protein [Streptomyces sp. PT12]RBM17327.1 DoxX family protein [Streptomyces sp. PT12]